uniref:SH3 domain-containing protein n=2 Tax=Meloidogyne incognita group TaxID=654580 RepID=A0A915NCK7_MELJA
MDTESDKYGRNILQQNIRDLLDSSLPAQISQLEESTSRLEHLAAYCEANYLQSQNKADALLSTKQCTLQSLAGVAYIVGELSRSLQNSLELEQINLSQKTGEIENICQLIAIRKEKAARREIGKLTTAKNVVRQTKIIYPSTEEPTPRYQRTAIDFSILDGVGHGRRVTSLHNNDYGSIGHSLGVMNAYAAFAGHISGDRSISTTSAESTDGVAIGGVVQQQRLQPVYDYYSRSGNYGTLTRGSIRSAMGGEAICGATNQTQSAHQQLNSSQNYNRYHSSMLQPAINVVSQQQIYGDGQHARYASTIGLNEQTRRQTIGNTNRYNNNNCDYGTLRPQQVTTMPIQSASSQQDQHYMINCHRGMEFNELGNNEPLDKSADYSDDALPLPPPLLLSAVNIKDDQHIQRFGNEHDDSFPLPPPPLTVEQESINCMAVPNWVPHQYIEKAFVLYDYESRNADELRLYQGATVYVLKKNEDGWFEGVMDGITGLFPGNYVQTLQN